jgi:hypothetical protein
MKAAAAAAKKTADKDAAQLKVDIEEKKKQRKANTEAQLASGMSTCIRFFSCAPPKGIHVSPLLRAGTPTRTCHCLLVVLFIRHSPPRSRRTTAGANKKKKAEKQAKADEEHTKRKAAMIEAKRAVDARCVPRFCATFNSSSVSPLTAVHPRVLQGCG